MSVQFEKKLIKITGVIKLKSKKADKTQYL